MGSEMDVGWGRLWSWEQRVAHYMRRRDGRDAGGGMVWGVAAGERS